MICWISLHPLDKTPCWCHQRCATACLDVWNAWIPYILECKAISSDHAKEQDFLSHLLKNLASHGSTYDGSNLFRLIQDSQKIGTFIGTSSEAEPTLLSNAFARVNAQESPTPLCTGIQNPLASPISEIECVAVASLGMPHRGVITCETVETEQVPSTEITNVLPI